MSAAPLAQFRTDLAHAARIILTNGLMQGSLYDYEQADRDGIPPQQCRMCGLGAIHTAITGTPSPERWTSDRYNAVTDHLNDYLFHLYGGAMTLPKWNDQPGRTATQVARLLRKAALWTPTAQSLALAA